MEEYFHLQFTDRSYAGGIAELSSYEIRDSLAIRTEFWNTSDLEAEAFDWWLTVPQARILRGVLDRWIQKQEGNDG